MNIQTSMFSAKSQLSEGSTWQSAFHEASLRAEQLARQVAATAVQFHNCRR